MTNPATVPVNEPAAPPSARTWVRRRRWHLSAAVVLVAAGTAVAWRLTDRPAPEDPTLARLEQARADLTAARFPEAKDHLRAVLDKWPLDAEAHFLLARTCRRDDDLGGWHHHLRTAAVLQWSSADVEREWLLARVQSGDVWRGGAELAAADPGSDDGILATEALAKGYLATYRLDDLLALTKDWSDRRPGDWQPYYLRGQAYLYGRLLSRAADEFRAVLERNPGHPTARVHLARALMVDGLYEPARAEYEAVLAAHPDHPEALSGLANCQLNLAQPDAARAILDRLFAVAPDHPAGCYIRAQIEAQSDPAAALDWLRRAERRAPRETDITSALIRVLNQLGRHDEAACYQWQLDTLRAELLRLDDLRRAVRADPAAPSPRLAAGELCLALDRPGEAASWFESVLALDSTHEAARRALSELVPTRESGQVLGVGTRVSPSTGRGGRPGPGIEPDGGR